MNTDVFDFDSRTVSVLSSLETNGRIPHAIIIEGSDREKTLAAAKFLSMYAVCTSEQKPCAVCNQCHKAMNAAHADIYYAQPEGKSGGYSIKQLRKIIDDAYIKPNEADAKVYILADAENRLSAVQQNALLKLIEEPPKNVVFIFTCENSRNFLITIRSRCTILRLFSEHSFDEDTFDSAKQIISGMLSSKEYDLLKSLTVLSKKDKADDVLSVVTLILRDGLMLLSGGKPKTDEELGRKLSLSFNKRRIMELIEVTEDAKTKIAQYININLLTTWLCGEYRRISWQR